MGRWTDLATWVGPTANRNAGGQRSVRGLVEHIASGSYDGTISWQRTNVTGSARTSSHFIVARDGRIAQMVDTADRAWAQGAGNDDWLSVENEGRVPGDTGYKAGLERLTDAQIEANARLLARAHQVYGVPLQLATSPSGRGLGHHSMGAESGVNWGHSQCPGTAIKAQKPGILARAIAITNGDDDMYTDSDRLLAQQTLAIVRAQRWAWQTDRAEFIKAGGDAATWDFLGGMGDNTQAAQVDQLLAAVSALTAEVTALRSVIETMAGALAAGGGSIDTAAILAGVDTRLAALRTEVRDAVADLGEGGAEQVRADAPAG